MINIFIKFHKFTNTLHQTMFEHASLSTDQILIIFNLSISCQTGWTSNMFETAS